MTMVFDGARTTPPNPLTALATGRHDVATWRTVSASWRLIQFWAARRRQRLALRELADTPHLLADIGITHGRALREAAKPFWQLTVPSA
jgi:uncharacterized protein YjiS (DUF1127 family)